MLRLLLTAGLWLSSLLTTALSAQHYTPDWPSLDARPLPGWYDAAKFGIFIHWGVYSVPAWATDSYADGFGSNYAEWYWQRLHEPKLKIHQDFVAFHEKTYGSNFRYQDFAPLFKAELFKPDQWAELFRQSGARYVVLTSKHHEGFCLWPSPQAWNWNAVDIGPHRDLLGELTTAVRKKGLRMGYYYSLYEWFNPIYTTDVAAYVTNHMLPQMKELVTRYRPDVLWTDGQWEQTSATWQAPQFLAWLYNESPVKNQVVVNDRWGSDTPSKHGGFFTSEYNSGSKLTRKWEECRGIGQSFGYNRNENLADYATAAALIRQLISIVAGGGNLLLNIGPAADGTIPVIQQERLLEIGQWLSVNGEAIYDSSPWEHAPATDKNTTLFFTKKGNTLYALTTAWPATLTIQDVPRPQKVSLVGYRGQVGTSWKNNTLTLTLPAVTPATLPGHHAWVLKIE